MLYLEDYLEMIEHLPQELRDRFTEMRELDLQVQNSMDSLEKRVSFFFSNAKRMKPSEKEAEHEVIRKDYYKNLEDAEEKVHLANQMYDLVNRYLRRLDQESQKFKLELEADHSGITEILEKRSHDMDNVASTNSSQKENRYSLSSSQRMSHHAEKRRESVNNDLKRLNVEKMLPTEMRVRSELGQSLTAPVYSPLGHIGAGGSAIAAAASQAIAATQQMQQGRRTASLKASYEAIHSGGGGSGGGGTGAGQAGGGGPGAPGGATHPHEISISKELAGAAQTAIAAIQDTHKKHKKKGGLLAGGSSTLNSTPASSPASVPSPSEPPSSAADRGGGASESYDPNEPRYCICNEVAFGTMVACDNKSCPYEWYHYPCVGITDKPKGKWYCPHCTAAMKKRSRKTQ